MWQPDGWGWRARMGALLRWRAAGVLRNHSATILRQIDCLRGPPVAVV
jgi:hypothetical protein